MRLRTKPGSTGVAGKTMLGLARLDQHLGLRHPFFALDAALERQPRVHHGNRLGVPGGNLAEMEDAVVMQDRFKFRAYALDLLEIVGLPIDRADEQSKRGVAEVGRFGRLRRLRLSGLHSRRGALAGTEYPLEQIADKATDEKSGEQQQRAGNNVRRGVHELAFSAPLRVRRTIRSQCRSARPAPETAS